MNELLSLFPVLFLVYLLQCIGSVSGCTKVFLVDSRKKFRVLRHYWIAAGSQFRLFLLNPFLPSSSATCVDAFPFSFITDPSGHISGVNFDTFGSGGLVDRCVTLDSPHRFISRSKQLLVDYSPVARLHSECRASQLANFLKELQTIPLHNRSAFLEEELRRTFALAEVKTRLENFSERTNFLSNACFSLFLFVFLVAPSAIYVFGLSRLWRGLLVGLVVYSTVILSAFRRARRDLHPQSRQRDFQHLLTIAISPFAAIRALDLVAVDLFQGLHPVAVAFVVLPKENFLTFVGPELRKVKFLMKDPILEQFLGKFLSSQNIEVQTLLAPPLPNDVHSLTYCPACLTQYVLEYGTCADCGGVRLEALPRIKA